MSGVSPIFYHKIWTIAWILRMILSGVISLFLYLHYREEKNQFRILVKNCLCSKYVMWSQNFISYSRTVLYVHIFGFHYVVFCSVVNIYHCKLLLYLI
jgi:hypothetical protein